MPRPQQAAIHDADTNFQDGTFTGRFSGRESVAGKNVRNRGDRHLARNRCPEKRDRRGSKPFPLGQAIQVLMMLDRGPAVNHGPRRGERLGRSTQEAITWLTCWRDRDGISVVDRATPCGTGRGGVELPDLPNALGQGSQQAFRPPKLTLISHG